MATADGIILASPTYFADVSTEIKALIDRAGLAARANGNMLRRKAGAAWSPCGAPGRSMPSTPSTTSS